MISMIQPLPVGNALRLFLVPPMGSANWRVLRKADDSFTGHDDPDALIAYEGDERIFIDNKYLQNEVMAFYRPFYRTASGWQAGPTATGTPAATYTDYSTDVLSLLRERLEAGLKVEVLRGTFQPELGYVQVYTAPPSLEQGLRFPLVTLHLDNDSPAVRGIGENISADEFDSIGLDWDESEGWLAQVQLSILGWTQNSDERIDMRKALKRLIVGNLPVLSDQGIEQVDASFQDIDLINGEFTSPIYQVMCSFSCIAPVRVGNKQAALQDVEVTVDIIGV